MKTISKESEVRILDAIQDVCGHVNDGSNPTDAVIKVAEDRELNKHFIRLVCTGYNTGATTYQREKGAGVLDKLADFPIANTEKAIDALYPSKILSPSVKKASTAVSDEYSKAPTAISDDYLGKQEKAAGIARALGHNPDPPGTRYARKKGKSDWGVTAHRRLEEGEEPKSDEEVVTGKNIGGWGLSTYNKPEERDEEDKKKKKKRHDKKAIDMKLDYGIEKVSREIPREEQLQHAMNQRRDIKREVQNHKTKYANSQDILLSSLGQLGDYFKQAHTDWSFEEVDSAMSHRFSKAGSIVMDFVFDRNGSKEKRAQAKTYKAVDWDAVPFKLATDCIKQAQAVNSLRTKYDSFSKEAAEKIAELYAPFYPAPTENKVATTSVLGKSGMGKRSGIISSVIGSSLASSAKHNPGASAQASTLALDLEDPEHTDEMRAIKARTMIQDFLLNDEVIAGYDPDEVITAYNEISQLSPRSAVQPAIIRPLLRKRLTQGAIEPFEAAEMTDIENKLMQNQDATGWTKIPRDASGQVRDN